MKVKNNILYYPVLHGIGDMFPAIAYALHCFKDQPFKIIGAGIFLSLREVASHYKDFYRDIASAFTTCEGIEFLDFTDVNLVENYLLKLEQDESVNVVCTSGINMQHGYGFWRKNNIEYQKSFKNYFDAKVDKEIESYISKEKVNICFQLRRTRDKNSSYKFWAPTIAARDVDIDKWVEFLLWLASEYDFNLIGIGDSDKLSPWYIDPAEFKNLIDHENVHMPAWTRGTSLLEDMYFMQKSDIFIGTHSGPQVLSWLLSQPSICFDFGIKQRLPIKNLDYRPYFCSTHQKVCWGNQSLDEMKFLFNSFYKGDYLKFKGLSLSAILDKQKKQLHRKCRSLLRKIQPNLFVEQFNTELAKISFKEEIPLFLLPYKYASISYAMGNLSLQHKEYEKAISFFEDSWAFVLQDAKRMVSTCEQLINAGHEESVEKLLLFTVSSLDSIESPDMFVEIVFYLATYYKIKGRAQEAEERLKSILYVDQEHTPTLRALGDICKERDDFEGAEFFYNKASNLN